MSLCKKMIVIILMGVMLFSMLVYPMEVSAADKKYKLYVDRAPNMTVKYVREGTVKGGTYSDAYEEIVLKDDTRIKYLKIELIHSPSKVKKTYTKVLEIGKKKDSNVKERMSSILLNGNDIKEKVNSLDKEISVKLRINTTSADSGLFFKNEVKSKLRVTATDVNNNTVSETLKLTNTAMESNKTSVDSGTPIRANRAPRISISTNSDSTTFKANCYDQKGVKNLICNDGKIKTNKIKDIYLKGSQFSVDFSKYISSTNKSVKLKTYDVYGYTRVETMSIRVRPRY